jgi:hypothetical protein
MVDGEQDGTEAEARTWPGTEHWFANVGVAACAPGQATGAWSATVAFLRRHLGRSP